MEKVPGFIQVGRTYSVFPAPSPASGSRVKVVAFVGGGSNWVKVVAEEDPAKIPFWMNVATLRQIIEEP